MKNLSILASLLLFSLIFVKSADAKLLPQAVKSSSKQPSAAKNAVGTGIGVTPKLRADRRALIVYFSNLQNAKSVSYALTYATSTQPEGAIGSLNLGGLPNASQELLFGTCSKNVCRYHTGINNARLEVAYTTQAGKKYLRRYKIKL